MARARLGGTMGCLPVLQGMLAAWAISATSCSIGTMTCSITRVDLSLERQPYGEASNWLSAAAAADGWSKLIGIQLLACFLSLLRILCAARGCAIDALARLVRLTLTGGVGSSLQPLRGRAVLFLGLCGASLAVLTGRNESNGTKKKKKLSHSRGIQKAY